MRKKWVTGMLPAFFPVLVMIFTLSSRLTGQNPPRRASSVPDLFNQEAEASDPAGIQKYSKDLIALVVPDEAGKGYIDSFANRLARAEQMARMGRGKLVAEADVVRAFNELMKEIGAPSSLRTDEASMRRFREHAGSIKAFPALFSADRNGTNCNPGEAVFLFHLLISDNGKLSEQDIDSAQMLMQRDFQRDGGRSSVAGHIVVFGSSASELLSSYSSHHNPNAAIALFNNLAATLGF